VPFEPDIQSFSQLQSQRTIRAAIPCRGVGVHTGVHVTMTLHPAPAGSGIVFRRSDRSGAMVAANWRNVQESPL